MLDHTNHTPRQTGKRELSALNQLGLPPPPEKSKSETVHLDAALIKQVSELCVGFGIVCQKPLKDPAVSYEFRARLENGYILHAIAHEITSGLETWGSVEIFHEQSAVAQFEYQSTTGEIKSNNFEWIRAVFSKVAIRTTFDLMTPSLAQSVLKDMRRILRRENPEAASQRIETQMGAAMAKDRHDWKVGKLQGISGLRSPPVNLGTGFNLSISDAAETGDYTICTQSTEIDIIVVKKRAAKDPQRLLFQERVAQNSEKFGVQVSLTADSTDRLMKRLWESITPQQKSLQRAKTPISILPQRSLKL